MMKYRIYWYLLLWGVLSTIIARSCHAQVEPINKITCPDSAYVGTGFEIKYVSAVPDLGYSVDGDGTVTTPWVEFIRIPKGITPVFVSMPLRVKAGGWIIVRLAYDNPKELVGYTIIREPSASCKVFAKLPVTTSILKSKKSFKHFSKTHNLKGQYVPTK